MPTTKKTPAKKTTVKKKPATKTTATKTKTKATAAAKMRSFHLSPNDADFKSFKFTRQTLYWIIIVSVVVFLQLWILALQTETMRYIEAEQAALTAYI
jgi:hypothetical protein